jgi:Tol biopolymer transport system component
LNASPAKVFISYRREETGGYAGRLYADVVKHFGKRAVLMDLKFVEGLDFVKQIKDAVGTCDVLLVMLGPKWATISDSENRPRIEDADDFVRLEVDTGLRRPDVTVIPLLVAGAKMPLPDALPEDLRALSHIHARELSDQHWDEDVGLLVNRLESILSPRRLRPRHVVIGAGILGLAGIAAAAAVIVGGGDSSNPRPWITDLVTQSPITNLGCESLNCSQPSRQPDGPEIAFIKDNQGPVAVADVEGSRASGSTDLAYAKNGIRPSLAKTGRLAFQDKRGIWYTDTQRATATSLTDGFDATWSPQRPRIAFSRQRDNSFGLFMSDVPQQGEPVPLVDYAVGTKMSVPAWSPDGTRIAFIRAPIGNCAGVQGDVWIVNADGTGAHRLIELSGDERHPTWSPDSRKIVFSSDAAEPENYDLFTVDADGSDLTRRTSDAEDEVGPSWGMGGVVYTRGTFDCSSGGTGQRLWFAPLGD